MFFFLFFLPTILLTTHYFLGLTSLLPNSLGPIRLQKCITENFFGFLGTQTWVCGPHESKSGGNKEKDPFFMANKTRRGVPHEHPLHILSPHFTPFYCITHHYTPLHMNCAACPRHLFFFVVVIFYLCRLVQSRSMYRFYRTDSENANAGV